MMTRILMVFAIAFFYQSNGFTQQLPQACEENLEALEFSINEMEADANLREAAYKELDKLDQERKDLNELTEGILLGIGGTDVAIATWLGISPQKMPQNIKALLTTLGVMATFDLAVLKLRNRQLTRRLENIRKKVQEKGAENAERLRDLRRVQREERRRCGLSPNGPDRPDTDPNPDGQGPFGPPRVPTPVGPFEDTRCEEGEERGSDGVCRKE